MQAKLFPAISSGLALLAIYLYSMYTMTLPYKLLYLLIGALAVQGAMMEMESMGCTIDDCSDENVYRTLKTDNVACAEYTRPNWRRVLVMTFFVLLLLNLVNPTNVPMNFLAFFLSFTFWYFYMGFDGYHPIRVLCDPYRTPSKSSPPGNP